MERRSFLALAPLAALAAVFRSPEPEVVTSGYADSLRFRFGPDAPTESTITVAGNGNLWLNSGTTTYAPLTNITYTI